MRVLDYGGFVGRHNETAGRVAGRGEDDCNRVDRMQHRQAGSGSTIRYYGADAVVAKISWSRPTHVVHLAGIAAIPKVSGNVLTAWTTHVFGTLNLARAILKHAPDCLLIFAGSGQV
jgi:nucleoside-diphosphate-sugar epimerase